jgi:uncharacterized protein (DUF58 family)
VPLALHAKKLRDLELRSELPARRGQRSLFRLFERAACDNQPEEAPGRNLRKMTKAAAHARHERPIRSYVFLTTYQINPR